MNGRFPAADGEHPSANVPQGHRGNPSAWSSRIPVAVLAMLGCGISTYLALFQYDVVTHVWDPFFANGSEKVLTSSISRALPVSDATIGAAAYLLETILELSGGRRRWADRSWLVLLLGLAAVGLAVVGIGLVIAQPLLTGTFCTLCLASAALSFTVLGLVSREVSAAWKAVTRRRNGGRSWTSALRSSSG